MQGIAMLSMLIGHIGIIWFPDNSIWRIVGRIAFPIYAYFLHLGLTRTSNINRYLWRLGFLALISQIPYTLALENGQINVIGPLALIAFAIHRSERTDSKFIRFTTLASAAIFLELLSFDYGAYALLLVMIYRYTTGMHMVLLHAVLNIHSSIYGVPVQLWSVLPTIGIAFYDRTFIDGQYRIPKWLWRGFYPAHLIGLALIDVWF